jgi:hypothetical protein
LIIDLGFYGFERARITKVPKIITAGFSEWVNLYLVFLMTGNGINEDLFVVIERLS